MLSKPISRWDMQWYINTFCRKIEFGWRATFNLQKLFMLIKIENNCNTDVLILTVIDESRMVLDSSVSFLNAESNKTSF